VTAPVASTAAEPATGPSRQSRLEAELLALYVRYDRAAPWTPMAIFAVFAGLFYDVAPLWLLAGTAGAYTASCIFTMRFVERDVVQTADPATLRRLWRGQVIASTLNGLLLGSFFALVWPDGDRSAQVMAGAMATIFAVGATSSKAANPTAYNIYVSVVILPFALRNLLLGTAPGAAITAIAALGLYRLYETGREAYRTLCEAIELRMEREALIAELESANLTARRRALELAVLNAELDNRVAQRTAELGESEERYALAARGTNEGLFDWSRRTDRIYFSARAHELLGIPDGGLNRSLFSWIDHVAEQDRELALRELNEAFARRAPTFAGEYRFRHGDGQMCWIAMRGIITFGLDGSPERFVGSVGDISDRKRYEDQLIHDALHDGLTGLPNRALLLDRLGQCQRRAEQDGNDRFALLWVDLDRFRAVNDTLGHAAGDALLRLAAQRMMALPRAQDTVARLGSDEFVVLLDGVSGPADADDLADRLRAALRQPFELAGRPVTVAASVGIVMSAPGRVPEDYLRDGEVAVHRAKAAGGDGVSVFETAMRTTADQRFDVAQGLAGALQRDEFRLAYQPIVDLGTRAVIGYEALIRWVPEPGRVIPPGQFVDIAEETGEIIAIGAWALREATAELARRRMLPGNEGLFITVNVSPRQFRADAGLPAVIAAALAEHDLPSGRLRIEVTESLVIESPEAALETLKRLRSLGVPIVLDDFGTGYSSLSYLHRLRFDALKIDKSFVAGLPHSAESRSIIATIIALAERLGMSIVAEGVETEAQAEALRQLGCLTGQGYLYGRPLLFPAEPPAVAQPAFLERFTGVG